IRQRHAVVDQALKMEVVARLLELQALSFRLTQPVGDLLGRAHVWYSVKPATTAANEVGGWLSKPRWSTYTKRYARPLSAWLASVASSHHWRRRAIFCGRSSSSRPLVSMIQTMPSSVL